MKKAYTRIVEKIIEAGSKEDLEEIRKEIDREYNEHCGSMLKGLYLQVYDVEQLNRLIDKVGVSV